MASLTHLPASQRAIRQDIDGKLHLVVNSTIPPLPPGFVLVKVCAVAINPSDHKITSNYPIPGSYVGTDFSGIVVRAAKDVSPDTVKVGDMVSGVSFGFSPAHREVNGAFAEYVRARASLLLHVPSPSPEKQTISLLEAATLGIGTATCILALWSRDALGLACSPSSPLVSEKPDAVLVYGGSTATGTIALQMLALSGYNPIATCSPRNFDLARDRGASAVFDYAAPDVAEKIKAHTGGRLKYVLDCISDVDSVSICYSAIQRPGGRYVSLELMPGELLGRRRAIRSTFVFAAEGQGEEVVLGREGYDRPANSESYELVVKYLAMVQRLLDDRNLKPHPIKKLEDGLQGVISGLEIMASGGVSGKKMVALI
ncbi:zinc-binding dehydrogenase [Hypoxylon sp. FL1857]|nr:zinc-binding dehydrogenase [Hypoxylon sp. FL1857]